jgi:acetyl esterase/lipase
MAVQHRTEFGETFSWPLWSDGAGSCGVNEDFVLESLSDPRMGLVIGEVNHARCFCLVPENPNGRAVLVLAGGGYTKLVIEKEGFEVARWLCALGFHAYVLVHRFPCARWAIGRQCGAQAPVDDAIEAMRQIRARAPGLGIDPRGVGVLGLSSGGHLAACLVSNYPKAWSSPESAVAEYDWRPDFLIAGYGPISTNASGRTVVTAKPPLVPPDKQELYEAMQPDVHLGEAPPRAFLVYASDDPIVPVENGRRLHAALEAKGTHAELHIFAHAPHGFALRERDMPVGLWTVLCENWLRQIGMLPSTVAHRAIP